MLILKYLLDLTRLVKKTGWSSRLLRRLCHSYPSRTKLGNLRGKNNLAPIARWIEQIVIKHFHDPQSKLNITLNATIANQQEVQSAPSSQAVTPEDTFEDEVRSINFSPSLSLLLVSSDSLLHSGKSPGSRSTKHVFFDSSSLPYHAPLNVDLQSTLFWIFASAQPHSVSTTVALNNNILIDPTHCNGSLYACHISHAIPTSSDVLRLKNLRPSLI